MTVDIEITRSACCDPGVESITTSTCCDSSSTGIGPHLAGLENSEALKDVVKATYSKAARKGAACGCGCSPPGDPSVFMDESYTGKAGYVEDADLGLGCGIPTDVAGIEPGHRVLDLGSGAGIDAFIARDLVGESGHVVGVDFTPDMIDLARANNQKLGYSNVEFLSGDIEELPLGDNVVDVVVSNCVLNLVPDKEKAFSEIARVLSPGGHFCISDVVSRGELPDDVRKSAEMYAGCVAGAIDQDKYLGLVQNAGFENISILKERQVRVPGVDADSDAGGTYSITVRGDKPLAREDAALR